MGTPDRLIRIDRRTGHQTGFPCGQIGDGVGHLRRIDQPIEGLSGYRRRHDLRRDTRSACQLMLAYHRVLPPNFQMAPSRVAIERLS